MKRVLGILACISGLIMLLTTVASGVEIDDSMVLVLTFDDEGDLLKDSSIHGQTAALMGPTKAAGKFGNGLEFDGVDDYVQITRTASLDVTDGITLAAFVFKDAIVEKNECIISKKQAGAYTLELNGWKNATPHKPDSEMRISGTYHRLAGPDDFPTGRWVHVAVTYDGNKMKLYVDGVMVAEGEWPGKIDVNTADVFLGCDSGGAKPESGADTYFKGVIDEAIIINRALDDAEMALLAQGLTVAAVEPDSEKLSTTWGSLKASH